MGLPRAVPASRLVLAFLLAGLSLASIVLGVSRSQALTWSTVVVDSGGHVGTHTSVALDPNDDRFVSYFDETNEDLKVAICDLSASTNGSCDDPSDWNNVTVDPEGRGWTSLAVDADGNPLIVYHDQTSLALKLAMCDVSASANGNCDDPSDWRITVVDSSGTVGHWTSLTIDANGDRMISHFDNDNSDLKFAICDLSASTNGNCDDPSDWNNVTVDSADSIGVYTSIASTANGDPVISYYDLSPNGDLRFAICDRSASTNGVCDDPNDWKTATVDSAGNVGSFTSIAVNSNSDPMISYYDEDNDDLRFAICDISVSTNGVCDDISDWKKATVDSAGNVGAGTSIVTDANGHPMIAYNARFGDVKFASCDPSASANGNCDDPNDWTTEVVDSAGAVGAYVSLAVDSRGAPVVSYYDDSPNFDLKVASTIAPAPPTPTPCPPEGCPVGGVAELPEVAGTPLEGGDSSGLSGGVLAGMVAAVTAGGVALVGAAWRGRRRWGRR